MTTTENATDTRRAAIVRQPSAPAVPRAGRLRPLGLDEVTLAGGFWGERQETNSRATLGHIHYWLERAGWLPNFDLAAAGTLPEGRHGREFSDSEVYKYLEAVAWELGRRPDAELETLFRSVVARVAAAQEDDGYLNTQFGRPGQRPRWSDLEWGHELYCIGHLVQAAVARRRTSPDADDGLWEVALRAADLVCEVFGADGIQSVCGHAEIETALAELGRASGDDRYTEQARLFVERRGTGVLADIEWGRSYFQDDMPLREADAMRGHAVRANYLASGAADVAADRGDDELTRALARQWENTRAKRTYVTGGQGSHHQDEAFGADFELPPDRAYAETCAGIASDMLSWRLLLQDDDPRHADLMERTLLNTVLASPREDGRAFFYTNTLHQRTPGVAPDEDEVNARALASLRAPWFEVSCCPTNVARTLASMELTFATRSPEGVQIHQLGSYDVDTVLEDGSTVSLSVRSGYPYAGDVEVVFRADTGREIELAVRIPAWARTATVTEPGEQPHEVRGRRAVVRGRFRAGDTVRLDLPVEARFVTPDPRIDAVRGQVAVERGPLVLALESVDLPSGGVGDVSVDTDTSPELTERGARVSVSRTVTRDADWPYDPAVDRVEDLGLVDLVPYATWANRGPSSMRVWIPAAGTRD